MNGFNQLWTGSLAYIRSQVIEVIQQELTVCKGCKGCPECRLIENQQHPNLLWLNPEKRYTVEIIEEVLHRASYCLAEGQKFFFVFDKADRLSSSYSDRLLKLIEEPSPGYYFLFLADNDKSIALTIKSRCQQIYCYAPVSSQITSPSGWRAFLTTDLISSDPLEFLKYLADTTIFWEDPNDLVLIIQWWKQKLVESENDHKKNKINRIITVLLEHVTIFAMPGSGKLFWKNLFLKLRHELLFL